MNDLLLLATLLAGPRHGYALKKQVGLITGRRAMHNNLVYPLLRRFVENSWVSKRRAAGQRGQTREVYALTGKGQRELRRRLSAFPENEVAPNEPGSPAWRERPNEKLVFRKIRSSKRGPPHERRYFLLRHPQPLAN